MTGGRSAMMRLLLLLVVPTTTTAQFDWGTSGGNCDGSGSFTQSIAQDAVVEIGEIPIGLEGVRIELTSPTDVDVQLKDSNFLIVHWPDGLLSGSGQGTTVYQGMEITYSGYNGVSGPGDEYIEIAGATTRVLTMRAFGFAAGTATVTYSWTGTVGCSNSPAATGSGSFQQAITQGATVDVGPLPAGLTDVWISLESTRDIDLQLYDGSTAVINWQTGELQSQRFQRKAYGNLKIEYSGYDGEQLAGTLGNEYVRIVGTLTTTLTLKVLGYQSGTANVEYSWGYYAGTAGLSGSALKNALHDTIDGHTELSYGDCWDALRKTDQDDSNPNNVWLLYSQRSHPKSDQDTGGSNQDSWNREHVWAKSHGNFGTSRGAGTDIHALRPADKSVNTERSAKDFDNGGSVLSGSAQDCPSCRETSDTFEPPDAVKGDVARMIFYMDVRWNGDSNSNNLDLALSETVPTPYGSGTSSTLGRLGRLSTLKAWHAQDPVDDRE